MIPSTARHHFLDEDEARSYAEQYAEDPNYFAIMTETPTGWLVIVKFYPEEL